MSTRRKAMMHRLRRQSRVTSSTTSSRSQTKARFLSRAETTSTKTAVRSLTRRTSPTSIAWKVRRLLWEHQPAGVGHRRPITTIGDVGGVVRGAVVVVAAGPEAGDKHNSANDREARTQCSGLFSFGGIVWPRTHSKYCAPEATSLRRRGLATTLRALQEGYILP